MKKILLVALTLAALLGCQGTFPTLEEASSALEAEVAALEEASLRLFRLDPPQTKEGKEALQRQNEKTNSRIRELRTELNKKIHELIILPEEEALKAALEGK